MEMLTSALVKDGLTFNNHIAIIEIHIPVLSQQSRESNFTSSIS